LNKNAFLAARGAVDCALTAADCIVEGERMAYALVRPPGHHAERRSYGGFCYFNNAAVAANHLSRIGRVAILDIDYHHGNGQQDIFYERSDALTVSIHGHPIFAYPYFSGFEDETGRAEGEGFNLNITLAERSDGARHRKALTRALERVVQFDPSFLVVALGFDTAKGDPTGSWSLSYDDFERNGALIGALNVPTLIVQEGGYQSRSLGPCATHFFRGLTTAIAAS
jgi:acetoin utilization deacetylase AcuC-like enzyme